MARSSHPFSSPFSKNESEEERPRRTKQTRFFKPEPEHQRFKLEKLPEIKNENGGDTIEPPIENMHEQDGKLIIEVISNPAEILEHEVARVRWYLKEYARYKSLGYDSVLRFPEGIDPEDTNVTDSDIRAAIDREFSANQADYEAYARKFQETWNGMSGAMLPTMVRLYGFPSSGHFKIVPTAYGTGGGSLKKGGVVFFRLPKFRPQVQDGSGAPKPITEVEAITHEILCHEATAHLRDGTAIDDSPILATHQEHKERLMDLLGRTLLVRSGMMKREEVRMVGGGDAASVDVDSLYYTNPTNPDENNLRFEGNLVGLVRAIEEKLKNTSPS